DFLLGGAVQEYRTAGLWLRRAALGLKPVDNPLCGWRTPVAHRFALTRPCLDSLDLCGLIFFQELLPKDLNVDHYAFAYTESWDIATINPAPYYRGFITQANPLGELHPGKDWRRIAKGFAINFLEIHMVCLARFNHL
ncbi:hypothetical protein, partial [Marinimicrobium agarilyticum]|uniref:hypothetical protein n=1 Tax=Marinimicrobium agarilyticum TaxID=306546 RepID=UPI001B7F7E73